MAEAVVQKMVRNGITTPTTAAGSLTASTSTGFVGMGGFGLRVTTAIPAEIAVDPDDKVGFVFFVSNSATFVSATLTLSSGEGWQSTGSKAFTVGAAGSSASLMYILGPFESAKYARYDSATIGVGKPSMKFTLTVDSGAAPLGDLVAFKLPTVTYATSTA